MMNTIYYQGSDGCLRTLGDNELMHYKYIKKIGNRYFYTTEALQAYYKDQQKVSNVEYAKDRAVDTKNATKRDLMIKRDYAIGKDSKEDYERNKKINKAIYDTQGKYRSVKKTVKPVINTAKKAVTPVDPKKAKIDEWINGGKKPKKKKIPMARKKNTDAQAAYKRYKKNKKATSLNWSKPGTRGA